MSAGLTNTWNGIRNSYGVGQGLNNAGGNMAGIGAGASTIGNAVGTLGTLGKLGAFAGSPFGMLLLSQLATPLLGRIFGGASATDKALQQQVDIGKTLIPQLQQQAAGGQTPATKAQSAYLNQQINRNMQSQAASASRSMPSRGQFAQTTPGRAAQGRLQAARLEGLAGIMGQSQLAAQQQLASLYQGGMAQQAQQEQTNLQARAQVGTWLGQLAAMQKSGSLDNTDMELYNSLKQAIMEAVKNINQPLNVNTGNTVG